MCARLRDSWRMNPGIARAEPAIIGAGNKSFVVEPRANGGEPDASTQLLGRGAPASADDPAARMRRHLYAGAQAKRDRIYANYVRSIDYRTRGQTTPANATAVE